MTISRALAAERCEVATLKRMKARSRKRTSWPDFLLSGSNDGEDYNFKGLPLRSMIREIYDLLPADDTLADIQGQFEFREELPAENYLTEDVITYRMDIEADISD